MEVVLVENFLLNLSGEDKVERTRWKSHRLLVKAAGLTLLNPTRIVMKIWKGSGACNHLIAALWFWNFFHPGSHYSGIWDSWAVVQAENLAKSLVRYNHLSGTFGLDTWQ